MTAGINQWLSAMAPAGVSRRVEWLCALLLILSPVALALGIWAKLSTPSDVRVHAGREQAIAAARRVAAAAGIDASRWYATCRVPNNRDRYRYYRRHHAAAIERIAPAFWFDVTLAATERQTIQVALAPDLHPLGFDIRDPNYGARTDPGEATAAARATEAARRVLPFASLPAPAVEVVERTGGALTRRFEWRVRPPETPHLEVRLTATVRGGTLIGQQVAANVDSDYARSLQGSRNWVTFTLGVTYALFIVMLCVHSIRQFSRRAMQEEVSYARTLLVLALFAALIFTALWSVRDESTPNMRTVQVLVVTAVFAVMALLAGVLVGIAYASAEGGLREALPGKLTSLDALLTGRIFSSNVARAFLAAAMAAGWIYLLRAVLLRPMDPGDHLLDSTKIIGTPHPILSSIATSFAVAMMVAVSGIMQPLDFVHHYLRPRFRMPGVLLFAALAQLGMTLSGVGPGAILIRTLLGTAVLVAVFLLYDLLASFLTLGMLYVVDSLTGFAAVTRGWQSELITIVTVVSAFLLFQMVMLVRGRRYRDEEVRPVYAGHLAERLSMQAEVAAAREAQLRLLPQSAPEMPGIEVAASCEPARVVGGDFYDFFPLPEDRLGIFVAEGGNRGLASALVIALAKGFLMHTSRQALSAAEVLQRLHGAVGEVLSSEAARINVMYAVADTRERTLRWARIGGYPRIAAVGGPPRRLEAEGSSGITEGVLHLDSGEALILYTDGLAARLEQRTRGTVDDWAVRFDGKSAGAEGIRQAIWKTVLPRRRSSGELEDDLTAVVLRFAATREKAKAEVA